MKSNRRNIVIVAMSLLFFTTPALSAADKSDDVNKDAHADHHQACSENKHHGKCSMMSKADTDKDGKISKEEFLKYHEEKFEKRDSNKDGFIDKEEMHNMMNKYMHGDGHDHGHGHSHDDKMDHKSHDEH